MNERKSAPHKSLPSFLFTTTSKKITFTHTHTHTPTHRSGASVITGQNAPCILCPAVGGAMKLCAVGGKGHKQAASLKPPSSARAAGSGVLQNSGGAAGKVWAHVTCALFTAEVSVRGVCVSPARLPTPRGRLFCSTSNSRPTRPTRRRMIQHTRTSYITYR